MKTIIFDMDGTLLDSKRAICESINYIRNRLNLQQLNDDFIIDIINNPNKDPFLELYGTKVVDENLKAEFEIEYVKNYKKFARVYDGILNLLENCRQNGYFIALASNAPKEALEMILNFTGIKKYFDFVIGVSKEIPQKPDPTMLLEVLKNSKFKKAIFLGDSYKDEFAAKGANIEYLQVLWGFGKFSQSATNANTTEEGWEIVFNL